MIPQVVLFSVRSLEEIEDTKKTFRNYLTFIMGEILPPSIFKPSTGSEAQVASSKIPATGKKSDYDR